MKRVPRQGLEATAMYRRKAGPHPHRNDRRRKVRDKRRQIREAKGEHE